MRLHTRASLKSKCSSQGPASSHQEYILLSRNEDDKEFPTKSQYVLRYTGMHDITTNSDMGLPWWLSSKESDCDALDASSVPGSGRPPGGGKSNPLQYSCLGNPMDRRAWGAIVHGVAKDQTQFSS